MKLQGRNLEINMQGADVHLLHFELKLLGPGISNDEEYLGKLFDKQAQKASID